MPIDPNETDFANTLDTPADDATMRHLRVERLTNGESVSTDAGSAHHPPSLSRFRRWATTARP